MLYSCILPWRKEQWTKKLEWTRWTYHAWCSKNAKTSTVRRKKKGKKNSKHNTVSLSLMYWNILPVSLHPPLVWYITQEKKFFHVVSLSLNSDCVSFPYFSSIVIFQTFSPCPKVVLTPSSYPLLQIKYIIEFTLDYRRFFHLKHIDEYHVIESTLNYRRFIHSGRVQAAKRYPIDSWWSTTAT